MVAEVMKGGGLLSKCPMLDIGKAGGKFAPSCFEVLRCDCFWRLAFKYVRKDLVNPLLVRLASCSMPAVQTVELEHKLDCVRKC
jgi:hypothetical protein